MNTVPAYGRSGVAQVFVPQVRNISYPFPHEQAKFFVGMKSIVQCGVSVDKEGWGMPLLFVLLILLLHPVGFRVSLFLCVLPSTRSCFLREHCIITVFFFDVGRASSLVLFFFSKKKNGLVNVIPWHLQNTLHGYFRHCNTHNINDRLRISLTPICVRIGM